MIFVNLCYSRSRHHVNLTFRIYACFHKELYPTRAMHTPYIRWSNLAYWISRIRYHWIISLYCFRFTFRILLSRVYCYFTVTANLLLFFTSKISMLFKSLTLASIGTVVNKPWLFVNLCIFSWYKGTRSSDFHGPGSRRVWWSTWRIQTRYRASFCKTGNLLTSKLFSCCIEILVHQYKYDFVFICKWLHL